MIDYDEPETGIFTGAITIPLTLNIQPGTSWEDAIKNEIEEWIHTEKPGVESLDFFEYDKAATDDYLSQMQAEQLYEQEKDDINE